MISYDSEVRKEPRMVEAIEEGKIVQVPEDYAKREGLVILRNSQQLYGTPEAMEKVARMKKQEADEKKFGIDNFRKPLSNKNQVTSELIDNFHWKLVTARKDKNFTRKQVASAVGVSENVIKMVENGILPSNDFILVNKLESFFKVNLRKNGQNFNVNLSALTAKKEEMKRSLGLEKKEVKKEDEVEPVVEDLGEVELVDD